MSVFEAGVAFRIWADRHGLAPAVAASQVADVEASGELVRSVEDAFSALETPILRAINSRKVHAVAANEKTQTVMVYLNKAFTEKQKAKLPQAINGYSIEYRHGVIGSVGGPPPAGVGAPTHYLHNGRITCGSSIGLGGGHGAGTFGALVRLGGDLFGLSNNHVIGRCSYAEGGHPVLSPGNIDINPNFLIHPFTIGVYESSAPMVNGSPTTVNVTGNLDASLMRIVYESKVSAMQGNEYPTPNTVSSIVDGMEVQKVGRTTGHTYGVVTGKVTGFQAVNYSIPELNQQFYVFFQEAWIVEGIGGDSFSEPGDSGSLVVAKQPTGELTAVGLVFAGGANISIIVPLDLILKHFGATMESQHGV
jgi:hypothetical protein